MAINGCRPEFVVVGGRPLLATADYGDIRLYDPEALLATRRSSAPGVVAHRVLCGPFNQNLQAKTGVAFFLMGASRLAANDSRAFGLVLEANPQALWDARGSDRSTASGMIGSLS